MKKILDHLRREAMDAEGLYQPHAFIIRLSKDNQVFPVPAGASGATSTASKNGQQDVTTSDIEGLAVFVHEYLHYLQNISTISGLYEFVLQLRRIVEFMDTLQPNRQSKGSAILSGPAQNSIATHANLRKLIQGETTPSDTRFDEEKYGDQIEVTRAWTTKASFDFGASTLEAARAHLSLRKTDTTGNIVDFDVEFGTEMICEGLAIEAQRAFLKHFGMTMDMGSIPATPYRVLRAVYGYYSGGDAPAMHLLRLGTLALQYTDPGARFVYLCQRLKDTGFPLEASPFPAFVVHGVLLDLNANLVDLFTKMLAPLMENYKRLGKDLAPAIQSIEDKFKDYLAMRAADPFFDLSMLLAPDPAAALAELMTKIPPCHIYQELGKEAALFVPIGDPHDISNLRYQAIISFVAPHFQGTEIWSTSEFESLDDDSREQLVGCPLYGACVAPQSKTSPDICRYRPWTTPIDPAQKEICIYGHATAIFTKSACGSLDP